MSLRPLRTHHLFLGTSTLPQNFTADLFVRQSRTPPSVPVRRVPVAEKLLRPSTPPPPPVEPKAAPQSSKRPTSHSTTRSQSPPAQPIESAPNRQPPPHPPHRLQPSSPNVQIRPRHAKIRNFDGDVVIFGGERGDEDVSRGEVAVEEAVGVEAVEALADLLRDPGEGG
jgi:hypothetical protein